MDASPAHRTLLDRLSIGLEPEQIEVLRHDFQSRGPLLVLAGAGTGKTTVLTRRLALECGRGVPARSILALTFTRKAAGEMRERVVGILGSPGSESDVPDVRTYHSLGLRILSEDDGRGWALAGWRRSPRLMDEREEDGAFARFWMERFSRGAASAPSRGDWIRSQARHGRPADVADATLGWKDDWRAWEDFKREEGVAEQHDLVAGALTALERDGELLARWRSRSETVLLDEYQDTDRTQYRLVSRLVGGSRRVLAVGDDDQAIYGFRGADLRNVLDWMDDRPDGRILSMTANHRSLSPVVEVANRIFPDKPEAFRKILRSRREAVSDRPGVWYRALDQEEERNWIHSRIASELRAGLARTDICLLVRSNRDRKRLESELPSWARGVEVSTIHGAKGLEWPVVFVCGQDRPRSDGAELEAFEADEERRLFYVACTRARDRLFLTSCRRRPRGDGWEERIEQPWMRLVEAALEREPGAWGRLRRRFLRQGV